MKNLTKRTKIIMALGLAALVVLDLVLAFVLGRSSGTPLPGSQSATPTQSVPVPQTESKAHPPQALRPPAPSPMSALLAGVWRARRI